MATVASTSHINVAGGSFLIEERDTGRRFSLRRISPNSTC